MGRLELEQSLYLQAGCEFDISDPQQVKTILFDKLGLPDKSLMDLAQDHQIVADIIEYWKLVNARMNPAILLLQLYGLKGVKNGKKARR